jgi:hypothetical protein
MDATVVMAISLGFIVAFRYESGESFELSQSSFLRGDSL